MIENQHLTCCILDAEVSGGRPGGWYLFCTLEAWKCKLQDTGVELFMNRVFLKPIFIEVCIGPRFIGGKKLCNRIHIRKMILDKTKTRFGYLTVTSSLLNCKGQKNLC